MPVLQPRSKKDRHVLLTVKLLGKIRYLPVITTTLLSSLFVLSVPLVGPCIHLFMQTRVRATRAADPTDVPAAMPTIVVADSIVEGSCLKSCLSWCGITFPPKIHR